MRATLGLFMPCSTDSAAAGGSPRVPVLFHGIPDFFRSAPRLEKALAPVRLSTEVGIIFKRKSGLANLGDHYKKTKSGKRSFENPRHGSSGIHRDACRGAAPRARRQGSRPR